MDKDIQFKLNGKSVHIRTDPERKLLWALRTDMKLTGTKHSCGEGFCGSCTVLLNGKAELSCQFPLQKAAGKEVVTIEGLSKNGDLHPVQNAFLQHNALQCGFCTPGMILTVVSFLEKNPDPSEEQIKQALEGNLCRCGSYNRIIQAVQTAAQTMRGGSR